MKTLKLECNEFNLTFSFQCRYLIANPFNGWTAFHSACKIGYSELAEFLIGKFPYLDIDLKWSLVVMHSHFGVTPLHMAANYGKNRCKM